MTNKREIKIGDWVLLISPCKHTRVSAPFRVIRRHGSLHEVGNIHNEIIVKTGSIYAVFDNEESAKKAFALINDSYNHLIDEIHKKEQYQATASRVFAVENGGFNPND